VRARTDRRACGAAGEEIFDKRSRFVLDIKKFSSIIYIWYEGGKLRPALVRLRIGQPCPFAAVAELNRNAGFRSRFASGRCPEATGADDRRACQAAAALKIVSALARETHMKGGITDNGEESQGREEEGRQEAVS
jgi:hypothetical protein